MDENDAVKMYLREVAKVEPLTPDEERRLLATIASRGTKDVEGERAAREVIENKLALVVTIAEQYSSSGIPMLDLFQEGNIGLIRAVDSFAASGAEDFSAYAASRIKDAILKLIPPGKSDPMR